MSHYGSSMLPWAVFLHVLMGCAGSGHHADRAAPEGTHDTPAVAPRGQLHGGGATAVCPPDQDACPGTDDAVEPAEPATGGQDGVADLATPPTGVSPLPDSDRYVATHAIDEAELQGNLPDPPARSTGPTPPDSDAWATARGEAAQMPEPSPAPAVRWDGRSPEEHAPSAHDTQL